MEGTLIKQEQAAGRLASQASGNRQLQPVPQNSAKPVDTRQEVAHAARVSHDTALPGFAIPAKDTSFFGTAPGFATPAPSAKPKEGWYSTAVYGEVYVTPGGTAWAVQQKGNRLANVPVKLIPGDIIKNKVDVYQQSQLRKERRKRQLKRTKASR